MRWTKCRICGNPVYYDEAIPARRARSRWRRGFVHPSCLSADLELRKARLAHEWEAAGQRRLFEE